MAAKDKSEIPMLDLRAQCAALREEIRTAMDAVLAAGQFILGPNVRALEEEVARYCQCQHGVGLASGTDSLILSMHALGVRPGDEVIVPAFTYIATADTLGLLGATPVFTDILGDTFNMDPAQIEARITPRTRAIVPVHLFGQAAEMDPILEIARRHGLAVIEDNAQAIGASYKGRKTGTMGDAGSISFYPTKNLGAYGDGGMVITNSEPLATRLRSLRVHGTTKNKYLSDQQGWNSRLDELQAAILRVKLRHLDQWKAGRQANAARYNALLGGVDGIVTPRVAAGADHVYHQYTIRVARRDAVQKTLAENGIASTVYYPFPLHLQPVYVSLGHRTGDFPVAERAAGDVLSLPVYPELTSDQIERVAEVISAAARR
jgi:dTDP-4-amino-4,6-dideoxygalactose transaminase